MPAELARAGTMLGASSQTGLEGLAGAARPDSVGGFEPFAKMLVGQVAEVNSMQTSADDLVHQMVTGGDVNQAEVLTAVQKADLAFRMMLQVRNKLIEAYRELQQIQI
jgi:flagellar hook-basal body complex protein FliE